MTIGDAVLEMAGAVTIGHCRWIPAVLEEDGGDGAAEVGVVLPSVIAMWMSEELSCDGAASIGAAHGHIGDRRRRHTCIQGVCLYKLRRKHVLVQGVSRHTCIQGVSRHTCIQGGARWSCVGGGVR
ncbi:hypothetical protein ACS0TY_031015 [Phlomoides rotata]